jgi:hypothetical protein
MKGRSQPPVVDAILEYYRASGIMTEQFRILFLDKKNSSSPMKSSRLGPSITPQLYTRGMKRALELSASAITDPPPSSSDPHRRWRYRAARVVDAGLKLESRCVTV